MRSAFFAALIAIASAFGSGCGSSGEDAPGDASTIDAGSDLGADVVDASSDGDLSADWIVAVDPSSPGRALSPALLGHYDLSGALYRFDAVAGLVDAMKSVGFAEWRVGVARWEVATELFPTLTDPTMSCAAELAALPPEAQATESEDALLAARDWFVDDGAPVTVAMTNDDARYQLSYVRSVLDVVASFGATPYVDLDEMPRALSTNRTTNRGGSLDGLDPCEVSFANTVSNAPPADPNVFAAAAVGLVKRVVEGSGSEPPRVAPYWEIWNEPELKYAWDYDFESAPGKLDRFFAMAVATLVDLAAYRASSTSAAAKSLHFGLGSFAHASTAVATIQAFDANPLPDGSRVPIDFVSFHSYSNDPAVIVADVRSVVAARAASDHHASIELALSEWGPDLSSGPSDATMDRPLVVASALAMSANLGLDRAHQSIFYDYFAGLQLGLLDHDVAPRPLFQAYVLLHRLVASGASLLSIDGHDDGGFDGGMGAALAVHDASGTRVLVVNRFDVGKRVRVDVRGVTTTPIDVTSFDDPTSTPHDVAPTPVIVVPPRSIVLLEVR